MSNSIVLGKGGVVAIIVVSSLIILVTLLTASEYKQREISRIALREMLEEKLPKMAISQMDSLAGGAIFLPGPKFSFGDRWFRVNWSTPKLLKVYVYPSAFLATRNDYDDFAFFEVRQMAGENK